MLTLSPLSSARPLTALTALLVTSLALVACGGGGSGGGSDSTASGSAYTQGAISGFGSIIVNGVHYDLEDGADVDDDDDGDSTLFSEADLQLGMVVELLHSSIQVAADGKSRGRARQVRLASEIVGPVQAIGTDSLTVLGQTVQLTATTVFDDEDFPNRLIDVAANNVVEVYGFFNPTTGVYTATRIELEDATPVPGETEYKLRGVIDLADAAADTFTIGGVAVSYANAPNAAVIEAAIQASLSSGAIVRVSFDVGADGNFVFEELKTSESLVVEAEEAEIEGFASLVEGDANRFFVNGVLVQMNTDTEREGEIADGALVEVEGRFVDGVLIAKEVEFEDDEDQHRFELDSVIQSVDLATNSFMVKGVRVEVNSTTVFDDGSTLATLRQGDTVEVKGVLSSTGAGIVALSIEVDD